METGGPSPGNGNIALFSLRLLHRTVMNGGMDDALTSLSAGEVEAGIEGFRFFGLVEVAKLLGSARGVAEERLEAMDSRYGEMVPSDDTLVQAFEKKFLSSPEGCRLNAVEQRRVH